MDYINIYRDLIKQEEGYRDDEQGDNAGILNYYELQ